MKFDVNVNVKVDVFHYGAPAGSSPTVDTRLILAALKDLGSKMSQESDKLAADVAAETDVVKAAVAALNGQATAISAAVSAALAAQGASEAQTAAALTAIDATVQASTSELSAAVAANTPAAPTPPAPAPDPLVISTTSLTDATIGQAFTGSIGTTGGTAPVSISVTGIPGGISIDGSGSIVGTPTGPAETADLVVTATDSAGASVSEHVAWNILAAAA